MVAESRLDRAITLGAQHFAHRQMLGGELQHHVVGDEQHHGGDHGRDAAQGGGHQAQAHAASPARRSCRAARGAAMANARAMSGRVGISASFVGNVPQT
ncbi:MAG: hypothetical protein B7Y61_17400 [Rhizobiales bacterium 35-66-30]|nr:MAG: hypothetical protein B7Y61_17400 [Rhizobiales bacterium 35-66-30]